MKQLLIRLLSFLVLLLILSYPLSFFISSNFNTYNKQDWILHLEGNTYDYGVLGSSRVYNVVDINTIDSICNTSGVNLGTSGSNFAENYLVLQYFLEHNTIKNLILNIDEFSLDAKNSFGEGKPFHVYEFLPLMEDSRWNEIFRDNLPFWKYVLYKSISLSKYVEYNDQFTLKTHSKPFLDITKGSSLVGEVSTQEVKLKKRQRGIDKNDVKYLNKIVGLCDSLKINLLFFTSPIFSETIHPTKASKFINEYSTSHGIEYYPFYDYFEYSNLEYYKDITHTNRLGSIIFSKNLALVLDRNLFNES